ncbi:MAG: hypothetical protein IPK60_21885 [Sandaracinaceae bacterium]|nr:hypothetical protein [Sandaracinaceae bacterium]
MSFIYRVVTLCAVTIALCACGDDAATPTDAGTLADMTSGDALFTIDMPSADGSAPADAQTDGRVTLHDDMMVADAGRDSGVSLEEALTTLRAMWCTPAASTACAHLADCGCATVPRACTAAYEAECETIIAPLATDLAAGNTVIVPSAATACLAELERAYAMCISPPASRESPCGRVTVNAAPIGTRCYGEVRLGNENALCANGEGYCNAAALNVCIDLPIAGGACFHACVAPSVCLLAVCVAASAEGRGCDEIADCTSGLLCIDRTCQLLRNVGMSCDSLQPCRAGLHCASGTCAEGAASCTLSSDCGSGETCIGETVAECVPNVTEGENCDASACADGLLCDSSSGTGICRALPGEGDDCSWSGTCSVGAFCERGSAGTTCRPKLGIGETCSAAAGPSARPARPGPIDPARDTETRCAAGLGCAADGTCQPLPTDGMPCSADLLCAEGMICNTTLITPTCATLGSSGATCFGDDYCADDFYCDVSSEPGYCTARIGVGTVCASSGWCATGLSCVYDETLTTATCQVTPTFGEACSGDCTAGLFCARRLRDAHCEGSLCAGPSGGHG